MSKDLMLVKSVEIRQREEGNDFAIVKYATLKGSANRICNEPEVASALKGTFVGGHIEKADVIPYKHDFGDGEGEQTINVRNIAILDGESLKEATEASGNELAAAAPEAISEEVEEAETAGEDAERA